MVGSLRAAARALASAMAMASTGALAGCGDGPRPRALATFTTPGATAVGAAGSAGADAAGGGLQPTAASVPTCSLGPNGGVCACADEPLAVDPPNLYFVLDRSGSMAEDNKWATILDVIGQLVIALGPRANVGAAVFPSPYASDSCAPGIEVFAPHLGDAPAGTAGPTAAAFLGSVGHIGAQGGTPTAATLSNLAPEIESLPGKTFVILATDGGPNCDPALTCRPDQCQPNIEGAPGCDPTTNCCVRDNLACLDAQPTIDAVRALAGAGVPVYVVGIPGSETYADLLNRIAEAGGTARTDAGVTQYYAVTSADQASFTNAISRVAARIVGTCTLQLNAAPPDPSLVNVFVDEQPLAQAGPDGWALSGSTVTILGASCAKITSGEVLDVRVVAGCPTVLR